LIGINKTVNIGDIATSGTELVPQPGQTGSVMVSHRSQR
jgi:hypothetical protein